MGRNPIFLILGFITILLPYLLPTRYISSLKIGDINIVAIFQLSISFVNFYYNINRYIPKLLSPVGTISL